ncbi:MAG: hypothetical protein LBG83_02895 [Oscillospiraceae bacterium]|jgi:hypothetical protein|nr:hypothetical protein [Oscillospiraceae bacterium]
MRKKDLLREREEMGRELAALRQENWELRLQLSGRPEPPVPPPEPPEGEASAPQFSRFPVLRGIDGRRAPTEEPPNESSEETVQPLTLRLLVSHLRCYAAAHFGFYAKKELFAHLLGAMAACDVVVFHNDSAARLPNIAAAAWGSPAALIAVQPGWRGGSLLGMPDPATRLYRETRMLRALYEAHYETKPCFAILDNLTAAPPEEYLAELWQVALQGPGPARLLRLARDAWPGDPLLLQNGALAYPEHLWLFGLVDDPPLPALMAAPPMHLHVPQGLLEEAFNAPRPGELLVSARELRRLFAQARLPEDDARLFSQTAEYLAAHWNVSIGPHAMRQMRRFCAVCRACGLSAEAAMDGFFFHRALRCLASADPALVRYETPALLRFLAEQFGKKALPLTTEWLER